MIKFKNIYLNIEKTIDGDLAVDIFKTRNILKNQKCIHFIILDFFMVNMKWDECCLQVSFFLID